MLPYAHRNTDNQDAEQPGGSNPSSIPPHSPGAEHQEVQRSLQGLVGSSLTPSTPREASPDPAVGNFGEYEPHKTSPSGFPLLPRSSGSSSTSPSTSAPSTLTRWARFHVPPDIFTNPYDPVRYEIYHQIQHEAWFRDQTEERPLTTEEAAQIPGSFPGESVLLGFYDRIKDVRGKTVLRCTICMTTNPDAQLYPRPDRAKIHMRHHFELRPIPCSRKCDIPNCAQRFFTISDLNAHVAGKTEPLATCEYCKKTMRAKGLKRHHTHFCFRAPSANSKAANKTRIKGPVSHATQVEPTPEYQSDSSSSQRSQDLSGKDGEQTKVICLA